MNRDSVDEPSIWDSAVVRGTFVQVRLFGLLFLSNRDRARAVINIYTFLVRSPTDCHYFFLIDFGVALVLWCYWNTYLCAYIMGNPYIWRICTMPPTITFAMIGLTDYAMIVPCHIACFCRETSRVKVWAIPGPCRSVQWLTKYRRSQTIFMGRLDVYTNPMLNLIETNYWGDLLTLAEFPTTGREMPESNTTHFSLGQLD